MTWSIQTILSVHIVDLLWCGLHYDHVTCSNMQSSATRVPTLVDLATVCMGNDMKCKAWYWLYDESVLESAQGANLRSKHKVG